MAENSEMTDRESDQDAKNDQAPSSLTIGQAQTIVDDWIKDIGVRYFSELTNLAQLVEEVGELSRIMSRTYGEQSFKESDLESCLLYTSPSPRDATLSRMPSSA